MNSGSQPQRCYMKPAAAMVDNELYSDLSDSAWSNQLRTFTVPKQQGLAWEMKAGQICRIVVAYGSQVGDVNMWNLHDFKERFYSGKTRQIHSTHLTTYDRLWSCLPYLRPMATITKDSLHHYGIDEYGGAIHDVIGTRCDQYTSKLITGKICERSCHQNITEAIKPWNRPESDVHDVFNIFMCTGFSKEKHDYFVRPSPSKKGDYIEFLAEIDLLVALSACPFGDVSTPVGKVVPTDKCFPLDVYICQPAQEFIAKWKEQQII